jgi:hypothetical protein
MPDGVDALAEANRVCVLVLARHFGALARGPSAPEGRVVRTRRVRNGECKSLAQVDLRYELQIVRGPRLQPGMLYASVAYAAAR